MTLIETQAKRIAELEKLIISWGYGIHGSHRSCNCPHCSALSNTALKLICTCPVLEGVQVTGSSCPIHGLPEAQWEDAMPEDKPLNKCDEAFEKFADAHPDECRPNSTTEEWSLCMWRAAWQAAIEQPVMQEMYKDLRDSDLVIDKLEKLCKQALQIIDTYKYGEGR